MAISSTWCASNKVCCEDVTKWQDVLHTFHFLHYCRSEKGKLQRHHHRIEKRFKNSLDDKTPDREITQPLSKDNGAIAEGENTVFHMGSHGTSKNNRFKVAAFASEISNIVAV